MTITTTAIAGTIQVVTSTGSMGASHTGLGVYEYGFSMRGNTLGVSTHREPFSYTPWGFPEHEGFLASYTSSGTCGMHAAMLHAHYTNAACTLHQCCIHITHIDQMITNVLWIISYEFMIININNIIF